jgi:hypothetical protein
MSKDDTVIPVHPSKIDVELTIAESYSFYQWQQENINELKAYSKLWSSDEKLCVFALQSWQQENVYNLIDSQQDLIKEYKRIIEILSSAIGNEKLKQLGLVKSLIDVANWQIEIQNQRKNASPKGVEAWKVESKKRNEFFRSYALNFLNNPKNAMKTLKEQARLIEEGLKDTPGQLKFNTILSKLSALKKEIQST